MMEHLGGPESPAQIAARQGRYEQMRADRGRMFKIVEATTGEGAGWVGYWVREWRKADVYEIGWAVLPEFQGKGLASLGTAQAIVSARSDGQHRFLHAFPSVDNAASNAICRNWASRSSKNASLSTREEASCGATTGVWTSRPPP